MPITKDQASDLKSAIDRATQTALQLQNATFANETAVGRLADALWQAQQPDKK